MFCQNCGKEIDDKAVICVGCGCSVTPTSAAAANMSHNPALNPQYYLSELSRKVKTEGIVWIVIASIQAVLGILDLLLFDITTGIILIFISALNFIVASRDIRYSETVLQNPVGIIKKYEPIAGLIGTLIYNLFFGGVIGVIGTIFSFVTRNFVMENKPVFADIEARASVQPIQ